MITTNSLRQTFNRRVLEHHLVWDAATVHCVFAIPDHPWVDCADGAAVRIAMTVAARPATGDGVLQQVVAERQGEDGTAGGEMADGRGRILADLTIGANVSWRSAASRQRELE